MIHECCETEPPVTLTAIFSQLPPNTEMTITIGCNRVTVLTDDNGRCELPATIYADGSLTLQSNLAYAAHA